MQGKFRSFFPHALENRTTKLYKEGYRRQRKAMHTLSRNDRAFIICPWQRRGSFHCYSYVSDNVGERSIPSDHVAVRIVVQKPMGHCDTVKRIPSWMAKHPVFCTILKQISDDHRYSDEPFAALADFKLIIDKARKQAHRELMRNTPGSLSAKLLIAATAMRAYRNRHLGTLMHNHRKCCWVQYGSESCQSLLDWVSTNCEVFREMKIAKYAKYAGTMIGPEGYLHRWTAPRKNSPKDQGKSSEPPRASLSD